MTPTPSQQAAADKAKAFVADKYDGDYRKAFDAYDANKDGLAEHNEIVQFFADVGVGSWVTRGVWAYAAIAYLDKDDDGCVSWDEFNNALAQGS